MINLFIGISLSFLLIFRWFRYLRNQKQSVDEKTYIDYPDVGIGDVEVDFITATRLMPGGVIRVEEVGGVAYTLTALSPENGGCFYVTGGSGVSDVVLDGGDSLLYDLLGRPVKGAVSPGVYIKNGRKLLVR